MKRITILLVFVILLFLPNFSFSQQDINFKGWGNTKWGMTENDIRATLKEEVQSCKKLSFGDGTYSNLEIPKYSIDGTDFKVSFEMGSNDDKLKRVKFILFPAHPYSFDKISQLLIAKYGNPTTTQEPRSRMEDKIMSWTFPFTKKELKLVSIRGYGNALNIIYTDQEFLKKSADKL